MSSTEPAGARLPRIRGIYHADDVASDGPVHIDDAFGWVLDCGGTTYLVRRDPGSRRTCLGTFDSIGAILRRFGRRDPLAVLAPDRDAVWPDRLTDDNDAFAFTPAERAAFAAELADRLRPGPGGVREGR